MFSTISNANDTAPKWLHPNEVLKLQRLKLKKKQLQARINNADINSSTIITQNEECSNEVAAAIKRKNPFIQERENKRSKTDEDISDQTLFKLFQLTNSNANVNTVTSFSNILVNNAQYEEKSDEIVDVGQPWVPIDWALKSKVRLMSPKPFIWNQKLKISEEASGITAFVRCLDNSSKTSLDTSPNARFHQCCLYWQHPSLPWINLFPRVAGRTSTGPSILSTPLIRDSLHKAWIDSVRSLFQLVRTRQCPYFYVCSNYFTVLFRAAGLCGFTEMNAIITPTTRGFRQLLRREEIEFTMPLKPTQNSSDQGYEMLDGTMEDEETPEEQWLESMGINSDDIKQINYTQAKIIHRAECKVDNSEQSLVLVEGMEVHALYNFLINSKSTTSTTGPLAGIPPTLLAPISFHGATLSSLKVRESKVRVDEFDYFSLEISGPILPQLVHNLCALQPGDQNFTATFANFNPTLPFSRVRPTNANNKENVNVSGVTVFEQENLSDCGLNHEILKYFCLSNDQHINNVECLKYVTDTKTYTWS